VKDHIRLLLAAQTTAAVLVLIISQILGNSQLFFAKLIFNCKEHFALLSLAKAGVLFAFMILPTICLGATFPLVGKIYTRSVTRVGKSIGIAYTINTIGAVLGSFCAGFVIIPMAGKELGLSLVAGIQLTMVLVIAAVVAAMTRERIGSRWVPVAGAAAIGLVLCFLFPRWNHLTLSLGKYHRLYKIETALRYYGWADSLFNGPEILEKLDRNELVYYGEGIGGFTAVRRRPDSFGNYEYVMTNAGKSDASSKGDMDAQTMSGHFPMTFHENPRTVMVLGLASGVTAGEMLYYPIERLDVIEISTNVLDASELFRPWNNDVLDDERTNVIIQDGRAHLQLTDRTYDVIISEPSNPWMAGLATLFTRDFFELAHSKLNEGGVFSQWLHAYQMDWETFTLVGRTFADVFPNSVLLLTTLSGPGNDYVLVGFKDARGVVREHAERNLAFVKKSKNVRLLDARSLYALLVAENLEELFGQGPINTDARPRLEFRAPRLVHKRLTAEIRKMINTGRKYSEGTLAVFREITADVDAQIDFAAYALSVHEAHHDMIDLPKATPKQRARFFDLMTSYCAKNPIDYAVFKDEELKKKCRSVQIEVLKKKAASAPDRAVSHFHLGTLYLAENDLTKAVAVFAKALEADPLFAEAHSNIGVAMTQMGDLDKAISHFRKAVEIRPHFASAYGGLGSALARQGRKEEAGKYFALARRLRPELFAKPGGAR
jgi:spermidine synthase